MPKDYFSPCVRCGKELNMSKGEYVGLIGQIYCHPCALEQVAEEEARYRLNKAAPALLAACKRVLEIEEDPINWVEIFKEIRQAIALAEGESK